MKQKMEKKLEKKDILRCLGGLRNRWTEDSWQKEL